MSCPAPFLSSADYSPTDGWIPGRVCGNPTPELQCCLPCNKQSWIYTNHFNTGLRIALWLNVPSLIAISLILLTFILLPTRLSHSHYLSVGLCISLIILSLAFILPLATQPDACFNDITPRDQSSSLSCAWSGALFVAGTMLATVWIMLRSVWIHLQLCWGIHNVSRLYWPIQILGWGIPALSLAITMPVTGVSYRLGTTCLPNQKHSYVTYIGWLMAFACFSGLLQLYTTGYCVWIYLRDAMRSGRESLSTKTSAFSGGAQGSAKLASIGPHTTTAKVTWIRLKRVMQSQWRSIGLCVLLIINAVYYGGVFTEQARLTDRIAAGTYDDHIVDWATCIVIGGLDPEKCRGIPKVLNEKSFLASFAMAGIIGMVCSLLLFRKSMVEGWMYVLKNRRLPPRADEGAFTFVRVERSVQLDVMEKRPVVVRSVVPDPDYDDDDDVWGPVGTGYRAKAMRVSSEASLA